MAILNNLFVNGASRFLNTAYFQDVSIGGTASLASLSLSGNLSVSGTTTLKTSTITGTLTVSNSIVGQNGLELYHSTPFIDFHFGNSTADYTSRIIEASSGTLKIPKNLTIGELLTATTGAITTLNSISVNAQNVNVTNNLRANHFDLQTVAQLGGSFYVSPTVKFPNSGTTLKVEKSGSTLTLTITDSSITSTTMAGVVWAANSHVKVFGTINGVVTGTMDGTVSSINTGSHFITLSVSGENSASVVAGSYTASQFSDLTVMIYQRRDGSNDYRVGIWMNCYDVANSSSTIRVYGGSDSNPNVMLGNLTSAGLGTVNNLTPEGWGLFAQNAFLHGKVVANGGFIGNWTIGTTGMYYNSDAPGSTSITMIPEGTAASTTSIGGSSGSKQWIFTGKNLFGIDTTGKLYASSAEISGKITATSGTIGGVTANSSYGLYTNSKTSATSTNTGFLISKDGAIYLGAYNSTNGACPFQVTSDGALTATSGKIGGWNIGASAIYSGTHSAYNSANDGIYIGQDYIAMGSGGVTYFNTSGTGKIGPWTLSSTYFRNGDIASATNTSVAGVYLGTDGLNISNGTAATTAYITKTAVNIGNKLTWNGTTLSVNGEITAASGTIGGITANSSYGLYTNSKTTATSTKTGFLISKSGAIYLGAYNSTNGSCPFQVTSDGILTATGANISGTLTAGANSQIGPWTVSDESIYKVSSTFGDPTSGAAYFGNDGLSIGGLVKIDARSGADTTISLGNTSSSNIAISSSGLMINNNTTPMATFNTEGIEMRGTDEQLLLDINTTGNPVTQSDSIVFSIQPIEVDSTHIFKLNEDINENLRNVIGNANVIVTFINEQEPSVLSTFSFNLSSNYNKNIGSGFTFDYKSKTSTSHPYFSITCSGIVYGSECELVIDISWNYTQYPYNYTFGTRSKYGVRGIGSTIIGKNLENTNDNALVVGQYNKNGNYLFAVGNGDSDSNRSNAFTVDNYGVVGFSGVAMFGDPGSTFYVTSHTVVNNASVASQSYKDGTITIKKAGYYPLCVAGYNSNTRYLTPVRFYLSDQQSGSASLHYMIFNPTSSARTGTCTMWVMWVKMI